MKTYFLIDHENVNKKEHFEGCEKISKDDEVIVFYSKDSLSMDLDIISKLNKPDIYKVEKGKKGDQSLDKHLLSYLGFLIGQNSYNKDIIYVILSKDLGYDLIGDFWKAKGNYKIVRKESFGEYFGIKPTPKKPASTETSTKTVAKKQAETKEAQVDKEEAIKQKRGEVLSILKNNLNEKEIGKENVGNILNFVHNHIKEKGKIYLELVKTLKQEKGLEIYNIIKKML